MDGSAHDITVFDRQGVEHAVGKDFHRFLQLVAERVQGRDLLQGFQELVVDAKDCIGGGTALNGSTGEQGTKLNGSGFDKFQAAALREQYVAQQIVEHTLGISNVSGLYLGDQFFFLVIGVTAANSRFACLVALNGITSSK